MEEKEKDILLEEYRQAMDSQRNNTSIVYSWIGNIFVILSTLLFGYGIIQTSKLNFIFLMILSFALIFVWLGVTETFIFYLRQRLKRINEIERILEIELMSKAYEEIKKLGWKSKFLEVRTYVRIFVISYIIIWLILWKCKF